jgi:hypothetical protein
VSYRGGKFIFHRKRNSGAYLLYGEQYMRVLVGSSRLFKPSLKITRLCLERYSSLKRVLYRAGGLTMAMVKAFGIHMFACCSILFAVTTLWFILYACGSQAHTAIFINLLPLLQSCLSSYQKYKVAPGGLTVII